MPTSGDDLDYFEGSLGNESFVKEIGDSPERRTQFINDLEARKFNPEQLLKFIEKTKDNKVRTLLIYHLLCQKKYISRLEGDSILSEMPLNQAEIRHSRLNALVHQLDVTIISTSMIKKLTEEAAISILCSVPQFHQLSEEQINKLVYHRLQEDTIIYWVNHYGHMPNANKMLVHLMKNFDSHICDALRKEKNTVILDNIMMHLNAYTDQSEHIFRLPWGESHLILAIERYLNGNYHIAYTDFINFFLSKKPFSTKAISLLFLLNDVDELQNCLKNIAPLINEYLKNNAQNGTVSPFYYNGALQKRQMVYPIHWVETSEKDDNIRAQEHYFNRRTNSKKTITSFEYFLIYYQGNSTKISSLIRQYLEQLVLKKNVALIHNLSDLLNDTVLCSELKTELFNNLLLYPDLFDEHVNNNLFLYHAEITVMHFGLKGGAENYQRVTDLCDSVLNKESNLHKPETLELAARAHEEAAFELKLSQSSHWFSGIYKYMKRSWFYGWEHFLIPKTPVYVLPESEYAKESELEENTHHSEYIPDLSILIETKENLTCEHFEQFINALKQYSLQNLFPEKEYATRAKLHRLFFNALLTKPQDELAIFLNKKKTPFLQNQLRLVELALITDTLEKAKEFSRPVDDDQANLLRATYAALDSRLPKLGPMPISTDKPFDEAVGEIFDQTVTTVTGAANTIISTATQAAPVLAKKTRDAVTTGINSLYSWGTTFFSETQTSMMPSTNNEGDKNPLNRLQN